LALTGLAWSLFGLWIVYANDCFGGRCSNEDGFGLFLIAFLAVQVAIAVPTTGLVIRAYITRAAPPMVLRMTLAALGATMAVVAIALIGVAVGS
jgi:hypothetical protein